MADAFMLLIVVCLLADFVACQSFPDQLNQQNSYLSEPPSGCTPDQIQLAFDSIDSCENTTTDITATLKCISTKITKNNTETWNIFVKNTPQNADSLVFWTFDNCSINLPSYGKLNRNYVLWPAESYQAGLGNKVQKSTKINSAIYHSQQKRQNHIQKDQPQPLTQLNGPNFICPEWKKTEVNNILTGCDISGNNRAAECIQGRIRDQMAQNWNVQVATTVQSDTNYYSFDGCSIQVNFGTFARRIYIWKATE